MIKNFNIEVRRVLHSCHSNYTRFMPDFKSIAINAVNISTAINTALDFK